MEDSHYIYITLSAINEQVQIEGILVSSRKIYEWGSLCITHSDSRTYKHRRAKHPHMVNSTKSIQCKESNCDFTCKMLNQLRHHPEETHGMPMETRVMDFKNIRGNIHL